MKKNITTVITVIILGIAALGVGMYLGVITNKAPVSPPTKAVIKSDAVNTDGKQIIEIAVKGGYSPKSITAKAGVPTVLRFVTDNTFDCSSSLSIPAINYRNNLPRTGTTDVDVPAQTAGTTLRGACSMGMYSFTVDFE
ncbi:MAG: cupredoxin domain-containing protein [Candidatus Moraniibacteriota bacterium]